MIEITPEQFLKEIREVAEKAVANCGQRDYFYPKPEGAPFCRYVHHTEEGMQAGCIVGNWAHTVHDVPLERLVENEGRSATSLLQDLGLGLDRQSIVVKRLAKRVQYYQDTGHGWLEAVALTEEHHKEGCSG